MSHKSRHERILSKVREWIIDQKAYIEKYRDGDPYLRPLNLADKFNVKKPVIDQVMSALIKEGLVSQWRTGQGVYVIQYIPPPQPAWKDPPQGTPYKRRVSWGNKKRVLTLVRRKNPWVVEEWYEDDQRWYMYMESGCERDPSHNKYGCTDSAPIAPEDQPDLPRSIIARWHFDIEGALQACSRLRKQYPKKTFRTRDTSKGDYVMGAILL